MPDPILHIERRTKQSPKQCEAYFSGGNIYTQHQLIVSATNTGAEKDSSAPGLSAIKDGLCTGLKEVRKPLQRLGGSASGQREQPSESSRVGLRPDLLCNSRQCGCSEGVRGTEQSHRAGPCKPTR